MTVPAQPYAPPVYAPVYTRKPPLTPEAKRGATIAGIVGFLMITLGWFLVIIPIAFAMVASLGLALLSMFTDASISSEESIRKTFDGVNAGAYVLPLLLIAVFGLAVMVGGLFVSAGILKSHGVAKAWSVTWAAFGISVVAYWIVSGILNAIVSIISAAIQGSINGLDTGFWIVIAITFVLGIAVVAVIGWLVWWWMAHAMRPATVPGPPPAPQPVVL